jgi:hypothetical protein
MEQTPSAEARLKLLTGEVRSILSQTEDEPVGVLTAYRDALLRLADAVDRLAKEIDTRTKAR